MSRRVRTGFVAVATPGRLDELSLLGRRKESRGDRGGRGGFVFAFKFSTLLLDFSVFFFVDPDLSKCKAVGVVAPEVISEADGGLSLSGLNSLPPSTSPRAIMLNVFFTTFTFRYWTHHSPLKHRSTNRLVVGSMSLICSFSMSDSRATTI